MDDAALRALALKISEGRVVGTWDERLSADIVPVVFLPLAMMTEEARAAMLARDIMHVYGVIGEHHTSGTAINGFPCFLEMGGLTRAELERLAPLIDEANALRASFTAGTS